MNKNIKFSIIIFLILIFILVIYFFDKKGKELARLIF